MRKNNTPCVLLIGGSDSGGGAGIQADLRVLTAYGLAGACAITGATAQNPGAVNALNLLAPAKVRNQIDAVSEAIPFKAIKIGMLGSVGIAQAVYAGIAGLRAPLVLDPVLIASSGGALLSPKGLTWLKNHLIPRATVLTPNLPEAEALLGWKINSRTKRMKALRALLDLGASSVLLKGGHGVGPVLYDLFTDGEVQIELRANRLRMRAHGTGCTFASAIAAELALGASPSSAVARAHAYLHSALANPMRIGNSSVCSPGIGKPQV